jgi:hypothetical protein
LAAMTMRRSLPASFRLVPPVREPMPHARNDAGRRGRSDTLPMPRFERAGRPPEGSAPREHPGAAGAAAPGPPASWLGGPRRVGGPEGPDEGAVRAKITCPLAMGPSAEQRRRLTHGAGSAARRQERRRRTLWCRSMPGTTKTLVHKNLCVKKGMGDLVPKTLAVQSQATEERCVRTRAEGSARSDRNRRCRHLPGAAPRPCPPGLLLRRVL